MVILHKSLTFYLNIYFNIPHYKIFLFFFKSLFNQFIFRCNIILSLNNFCTFSIINFYVIEMYSFLILFLGFSATGLPDEWFKLACTILV